MGASIRVIEEAVRIEWTAIYRHFGQLVGAAIHKNLPIQARALPIKVTLPVSGFLTSILQHRHGAKWILDKDDQVRDLLGPFSRKAFPRDSYALVEPPLVIHIKTPKNSVRISFHCLVFNPRSVVQWPLKYTLIPSVRMTKDS